ncbi:MAG: tRNA (adenosine(37)-N6)-threonylcarbamoyltransferase complex ATPase subunit type 1 TsaE [Patescibacteria group bacterium]
MARVALGGLSEFAGNVLATIWMSYSAKASKDTAYIVALKGDLGAGKTTFVQALCKRLGIKDTVQSPTYVLMKSYPLAGPLTSFGAPRRFNRLVHIDAYRLENPAEFAALKPEQFLDDPKALVVVEWPGRLGRAIPAADLTINFSSQDAGEGERYIEVV